MVSGGSRIPGQLEDPRFALEATAIGHTLAVLAPLPVSIVASVVGDENGRPPNLRPHARLKRDRMVVASQRVTGPTGARSTEASIGTQAAAECSAEGNVIMVPDQD